MQVTWGPGRLEKRAYDVRSYLGFSSVHSSSSLSSVSQTIDELAHSAIAMMMKDQRLSFRRQPITYDTTVSIHDFACTMLLNYLPSVEANKLSVSPSPSFPAVREYLWKHSRFFHSTRKLGFDPVL